MLACWSSSYGLEHHKALGFNTGSFKIFNLPIGFTPSFKTMAIPTSILVDENGIIQWLDQSGDYRMCSNSCLLKVVNHFIVFRKQVVNRGFLLRMARLAKNTVRIAKATRSENQWPEK